MKNLFISIGLIFCFALISSCETDVKYEAKAKSDATEVVFDSILAKKYGADDYGMKKYVMAFLKKGPNRDISKDLQKDLEKRLSEIRNL